jgi:hypothetical protein
MSGDRMSYSVRSGKLKHEIEKVLDRFESTSGYSAFLERVTEAQGDNRYVRRDSSGRFVGLEPAKDRNKHATGERKRAQGQLKHPRK